MSNKRKRAYVYIVLTMIIWGIATPVIKFTLQGIDPLPFIAYRLTISALISAAFFIKKIKQGKKFHQLRANFPLAVLYGLLAVPIALGVLFIGLDSSTVLDMTLIGVVGPLIISGGGALFFHDHITKREKIGIGVVIAGVLLNSFYPLLEAKEVQLTGNVLLLIYLLADSSSVLVAKETSRKKVNPSNLTNLAFIIGALTMIPLTIFEYGWSGLISSIIHMPLVYHLGVWYMAVASGSVAYYLYVRATKSIEVSEAALFSYLAPVVTIPLAIFWLKESLSIHFVIGALVISLGLFIAESKKKRYNSKVQKD